MGWLVEEVCVCVWVCGWVGGWVGGKIYEPVSSLSEAVQPALDANKVGGVDR